MMQGNVACLLGEKGPPRAGREPGKLLRPARWQVPTPNSAETFLVTEPTFRLFSLRIPLDEQDEVLLLAEMRNCMDENHQDKTRSKLMATEGKLWYPPLSPKDQHKLNRLRKKEKRSASNWTGFAGSTLWDW